LWRFIPGYENRGRVKQFFVSWNSQNLAVDKLWKGG
jgi:hypothetical protein